MISHRQLRPLCKRARELAEKASGDPVPGELGSITAQLVSALEDAGTRELQLLATQAKLVAACRAAVAAGWRGEPHPLVLVEHELRAHGWLPPPGSEPAILLAAPADPHDLCLTMAATADDPQA